MAEIVTVCHPRDALVREDRFPHIWCPGCGLGIVLDCYIQAVLDSGIPWDRHVVVSGIGCTGRAAGYLNMDSFHTTHGRAIPFAMGLKVVSPALEVSVISGDGDIAAIGGNHLIHAARRNVDINVICVNNFNYGMTGGQSGPTTPLGATTTTTPYGNAEPAFNLPLLAAACGAVYVARWTTLHVRQLRLSLARAMQKKGFTFVEVLAPCPVSFGKSNDIGDGIDEMWMYRKQAVVDHSAPLESIDIDMKKDSPMIVGNFVDRERPAFRALPAAFEEEELRGQQG